MDHYAPTHDLVHHWRTRTMIVSGIATLELVALVALGVVVLGKGWFQHAKASAATRPASTHHAVAPAVHAKPHAQPAKPHAEASPAKPMLSRPQTSVLVLNGNGRAGAAADEASSLRSRGYTVKAVGNAKRSDYAASMVMYRPGLKREALRLSRDLGLPIVTALDGLQPSQLRGAKLLVIVGR